MTPTDVRMTLRGNGYMPLPLNGKAPPLQKWQQKFETNAEEIDLWGTTWPNANNTGILCRFTPTLDIDILDADAAAAVEALVRERFEDGGHVLTRIGLPPKRAIPFRTQEPFAKIVVPLIAPNGDTKQKLEFLSDGQQVVVDGIHPDINKPYAWFGKSLLDVPRDELPYIRAADAQQLIDDAAELLVAEHGYKRADRREKKGNGEDTGGEHIDWASLTSKILAGQELHDSTRDLAASYIGSGMLAAHALRQLRALMLVSSTAHDERWQQRFDNLGRLVRDAEVKFGKAEAPQGDEPRFKLKRFDEIGLTTKPNYLIKGLLPRSGLAVIWGPPKCGKSFIAFDAAMHIALGREYRGRRIQQGTVVYCALEGGGGFDRRVHAWRKRKLGDHHTEAIPFYLLDVALDLIADHNELVACIGAQVARPSVVFVDTLNRALVGDENSSADMGKLVRAAGAIYTAFNCLVVLIHHCGVAGNRPRGHSSLSGADDAQIAVNRDKDDVITVTIEHMKDSPSGAPFACKLEQVQLGEDDEGDPMTSLIVVATEAAETGSKLTKVQKFAFDLLRKLIASQSVEPPADANLAGFHGCLADSWRKEFYATYPADKQATKKKALLRATLDLEQAKLIVLWREWIWVEDKGDK
jgi:hypothetical protein